MNGGSPAEDSPLLMTEDKHEDNSGKVKYGVKIRGSVIEDEDELKSSNIITLVFEILFNDGKFIAGSLLYIGVWSALCVYGILYLHELAEDDPDGTSATWLRYIENGSDPLRLIGSLFSFSLVFRFKICYDRWWGGRHLWGGIISTCLGLSIQVNRSIADQDLADRFNRYLIVFAYACKALLKHQSFGHDDDERTGDAHELVDRGFLSVDELQEIHENKCWEPYFCLDMMMEFLHEAFLNEGSFYLHSTKMQGGHYRSFDVGIKKLGDLIGDCISIQSADLPVAYDGIHLFAFFLYFTMAPIIWGSHMFWVSVPMSLMVGFIAISLIILGTQLCDPFGDDKVDIPADRLCKTIEFQIKTMEERRKRGKMKQLVALRRPNTATGNNTTSGTTTTTTSSNTSGKKNGRRLRF